MGHSFPQLPKTTSLASSSEDSSKISAVDQLVPLDPLSIVQKAGDARLHWQSFNRDCGCPRFVVVSNHGLVFSRRMRSHQTPPVMTSEALSSPRFLRFPLPATQAPAASRGSCEPPPDTFQGSFLFAQVIQDWFLSPGPTALIDTELFQSTLSKSASTVCSLFGSDSPGSHWKRRGY